MDEQRTVSDILERVRTRRKRKRCPDCRNVVSIRGIRGTYRWACTDCDALGIGYPSRSAALEGIRSRRR